MKYKKTRRYKYQTVEEYTCHNTKVYRHTATVDGYITLSESGTLTIAAGYNWDGATGAIDTRNSMAASLVHDALYQLLREKKLPAGYRLAADRLLCDVAIASGMSRTRARTWYYAVRLFGRKAAKPQPPTPVHEA